jgi:hypothetical protein
LLFLVSHSEPAVASITSTPKVDEIAISRGPASHCQKLSFRLAEEALCFSFSLGSNFDQKSFPTLKDAARF